MGRRLNAGITMVEIVVASTLVALLVGTGVSLLLIRARQDPRDERDLDRVSVVSRFMEHVTRDLRTAVAIDQPAPGLLRILRRVFEEGRPATREVVYEPGGRRLVRREGGELVEFDLSPLLPAGQQASLSFRTARESIVELSLGPGQPPVVVRVTPLAGGVHAPEAAPDHGWIHPSSTPAPSGPSLPAPHPLPLAPAISHGGRAPAPSHPPADRGGLHRSRDATLHHP